MLRTLILYTIVQPLYACAMCLLIHGVAGSVMMKTRRLWFTVTQATSGVRDKMATDSRQSVWRHDVTWPFCVRVCVCRRSTHHTGASRSEGGRQRDRHVHLPSHGKPVARRLLPARWRPAHCHPTPARPLLRHHDPARRRAASQPGQCAPRRRSHRLCGGERSGRPRHRLGHSTGLRRGTRWVYNTCVCARERVCRPNNTYTCVDLNFHAAVTSDMTVSAVQRIANYCIGQQLGSLTVTCRTCNTEVTQWRRFDSAPRHCRVTTLGKLFTHMCLCHQAV